MERRDETPRPGRKWIWPAALLVLLLALAWFARPRVSDSGGPLRQAQEASARHLIVQLTQAIKVYELDYDACPPGDGQGTSGLMKMLRIPMSKRQPFELPADQLDREGNVRNPVDEEKIVRYRCPGVRNPKSFDLWCEDAKGRADGINNWEK